MTRQAAIRTLAVVSALLAGGCGRSGKARLDASPDGSGGTGSANASGLTPCRDLSPDAISIVAAASSPHFLASSALGASVIAIDGWQVPRTFAGHLGHILAGAIAPDASWGATIGDDRRLRIWR